MKHYEVWIGRGVALYFLQAASPKKAAIRAANTLAMASGRMDPVVIHVQDKYGKSWGFEAHPESYPLWPQRKKYVIVKVP